MNSTARAIPIGDGDQGVRAVGLRRERARAGYTLSTLARKAGYTKGHLSSLEHGRHNASLDCLREVAAILGCDIAALVTETPEPPAGDDAEDEIAA